MNYSDNIGFKPQFFCPGPLNNPPIIMARVQKRKYEKIEQAEIDLVVLCNDSHEFYERYREEFPTRKKGIDSISKIWKRRGEFLKKQHGTEQPESEFSGSTRELEQLIAAQTRILSELSGMMKEQVQISREILIHFQDPAPKVEDHTHKAAASAEKPADQKEPPKKPAHDKPRADIMVGS